MANYKPATAPFNFINLPDQGFERYSGVSELPSHDRIYSEKDGYFSGEITYEIQVDPKDPTSVLMIGGGRETKDDRGMLHKEFFRNAEGRYTIPGSSIRGMIANNVMILGMCDPTDAITDSTFLYRDWASTDKIRKKHYETEIDLKPEFGMPGKVKAGYICYEGKKDGKDLYKIYPAKHDGKGNTFYRISEMRLRRQLGDRPAGVNYMYTRELLNMSPRELKDNYALRNAQNRSFRPYSREISFDTEGNELSKVYADGSGFEKGTLLCSGFIQKKKAHYVLYGMDETARSIEIKEKEIHSYQDDLTRKKEKRDYYRLPTVKGETKPVFYVEAENQTYFGMTPYLRIFYKHSVEEGIPESVHLKGLDYSKAMFGFLSSGSGKDRTSGYRSRVSFMDAVGEKNMQIGADRRLLLGEPKATAYPLYLEQLGKNQGNLKSYADDDFRIRGIKQYWFIDELRECPADAKDNVSIWAKPVIGGTFKGKIHFENLSEDELGLLTYALYLQEGAYHSLGLAKPYGYGKVKLQNIQINAYNQEALYSCFAPENPTKQLNVEDLIRAYQAYFAEKHNGKALESYRNVKELLYMRTHILKRTETEYQVLGDFAKHRVLPDVLEYEKNVEAYLANPYNFVDYGSDNTSRGQQRGGNGNRGGYGSQQRGGNGNRGGYPGQQSRGRGTTVQRPVALPPQVKRLEAGAVTEGVVKTFLMKDGEKRGVFIEMPEFKKEQGLLHLSKASKTIAEYAIGSRVQVKVIEVSKKYGKNVIALTDKDI